MSKKRRPRSKQKPKEAPKPTPKHELMRGTIRMHPKGFGFVIPENPVQCPQDVFIPKHLTDNAVDGDSVEVAINLQSTSEKGPEGKVVAVLTRARKHLAGTIRNITEEGVIFAHVPLLGASRQVIVHKSHDHLLKAGDRVILHVLEWGTEREPTVSEVTHLIGHINDASCDIRAAIEEFDLRSTFPHPVVEEAKKYGSTVTAADVKKRMDLRDLETFTIDPDTAKDYDDALSLRKDRKGHYHLAVHIADVAHYVKPGSKLDLEAIQRSNSTYFPGTCVPMLPEELSNELCSLKPNVDRLTVSVLMTFDKTGSLIHHEIVRAVIHSAKRFTYQEAKDVLDKKSKSPHEKALKLMVELCLLLKKKRYERGSIDFSLSEMVILVDPKGNPTGLKKVEYDITHQLVEEFMLKANEMVAREIASRGKELIYRVHEEPQEETIEEFSQLARTLGFHVPPKATPADLQTLFREAKDSPFLPQLSVAFIRSMKLASYSPENIGHYGLALEHYCHFTSPIRRYSDLIAQRLLFDEEPEGIDLKAVSLQCSEQERISFRAEMSVKTLKKLRLLQKYHQEDPLKEFTGTITKIKPFGLFFEIQDGLAEGFLHISELENDYFIYDEPRGVLYGRGTGITHGLGETLQVRLEHIDLVLLETKWTLAGDNVRKSKRSSKKRRRR
ncbi:MAG: VacB/RNase II family 3'-5' exoribonuclease [Verrucomicrobia bacterium]|nr:VacB/RNase II family 3'-5' exoribonuclease [Verrucomicrobiota bacterium]